jgi:hypothetical protein
MFTAAIAAGGLSAALAALVAQATGPQLGPAHAGDCAVVVTLSTPRVGDVVRVLLDRGRLRDQDIVSTTQTTVVIPTGSPLQAGQSLRLLVNGSPVSEKDDAVREAAARPAGAKPIGVCDPPAPGSQGESLEASAYIGWAYDQFAPDKIGGYPPGTTTARHNRMLFGVDFDYRMLGSDSSDVRLWLSGETLHGVRSADVDCEAENNRPTVCDPQPGVRYARAVLENATSLEAYVAPRLEFKALQKSASTPTQLYATARFGFIALEGAPRVYKNHHVGAGLVADGGPFKGSLVEFGWGMNEMLSGRDWKRLMVDGFLTFSLERVPIIRDNARFFIQMFIDNDLGGDTPDSIQTFLGFDLDVRKFFGAP